MDEPFGHPLRSMRWALLLLACFASGLCAQTYPVKPVRLVIGFPPGGSTDSAARIIAPKLSDGLGQSAVVDNRPGAGGNIAADLVAKSQADGYTVLVGTAGQLTSNQSLYSNLPYDPERDFAPVTQLGTYQFVLVVNPLLPARTLADLVTLAKEKPGTLNYASAGVGSPMHLTAELFKSRAGIDLTHIAYKGGAPATLAVVAGEAQVLFGTVATVLPQVRAGRLRAIAVTGNRRSPVAPDLPTIAELGYAGFEVTGWDGIFVPRATPKEVVGRLNSEIVKVLSNPEISAQIRSIGYEPPTGATPDQLTAIIKAESVMWAKVIKDANIRAD